MKIVLIIIAALLVIPLLVFILILSAIVSIPFMIYKIFETYYEYRERKLTILTNKELKEKTITEKKYFSLADEEK